MKKDFFITAIIFSCLLIAGCRKSAPAPAEKEDNITATGIPAGESVHKIIGAEGGELISADGKIRLVIPAGALNVATDINIQPVSNQLPEGIGTAYRLTPHGQQFSKPVSIVFNYGAADTTDSRPEFLGIAFQDATGVWQMLSNTTIDKLHGKLTATATHFSDWGYFKSLKLTPATATVDLGGFLELKVMTTFPRIDPDDAPPGTYTIPVLKKPRQLRPDEIKGWSYTGAGKLEPDGSWAFYTAPGQEPSRNPEAVAVNINMHRIGQFILISNITVLAGHGVDYLQVDEDYKNAANKGKCMLYMYGSFGQDPGAAKRSVKIDGNAVEADLWSPSVIRCRIDEDISGAIEITADGHTVARSVLRKFKGSFLYERFHGGVLNAGSSNALKETILFNLVYRGFGKPCPPSVNRLFAIEGALAYGTETKYTLSGSAAISTPPVNGCVHTTSVSLPSTSGWYFIEPHSMPGLTGFKCSATDKEGGIEINISYVLDDIIPGVRVQRTSTCGPGSYDQPRSLGVSLEGFNNKAINLAYWDTDGLILKGTTKLTSPRMSSGILIEAWDGTGSPSHYETDGLVPATFSNNP
jgi:hypothetical protein